MRVIVLGSGTSTPHPQRTSSSFWLETENGSLLLDISPSSLHRMAQEKCEWANLDAIWVSHFHLDHFGGLAPFLFGTKHAAETRNRKKPLTVFGPMRLKEIFDAINSANNYRLMQQPFDILFQEVEPSEEFEFLPNLKARTYKTQHTDESLAVRIESANSSLVFTSDTGFDEGLISFSRDVDLLLIECSFLYIKPSQKHLNLPEAIYIANKSNAKRSLLTHLYPEWDSVDIEKEMARLNSMCACVPTFDGLCLEI